MDPDLELRKGPVLCFFLFISLPAFRSFYDFFLPKIRGEGRVPPARPLDRPLQVDEFKEITGLDVYSLDR